MKIAVTGSNGKMGAAVIKAVNDSNIAELGVAINRADNMANLINKFDLVIDFSRPKATLEYLKICQKNKKNIVIGTTGFSDAELQIIKKTANDIAILLAPNMSIGVNLSLKLLETIATEIGETADIEIIETHHSNKVDSPSGTSIKMAEVIANKLNRDLNKCAVYDRHSIKKPRNKTDIGFSTIRGGDVVGEHTVSFFMDGECINITHKAFSRKIFATGAVKAANWLNKKSSGLYSLQDLLGT
jgi:4-hydroxy-tetrahydrodipicolinate reductase